MTIYQKLKKLKDYVIFQIVLILISLLFLNFIFINYLFNEIFFYTFLAYLFPVSTYLILNILYDYIIEKINE